MDILGTILGGLTGAASAIVTKVLDNRDKESERAHVLEVAKLNQTGEQAKGALDLVRASYDNDSARYGGGWVDGARGIVRPAITLASMAVVSLLVWDAVKAGLDPSVRATVVDSALYLATVAIGWWFGSRPRGAR